MPVTNERSWHRIFAGVREAFPGAFEGQERPPSPAPRRDSGPTEAVVTGVITPADIIGPTTQGIEPGSFDEAVRAIRAGATYANVHSTRWPQGEIRGQIRGGRDDDD